MNNIYLIGMRGVGKSTIGELLAKELGREFFDMDKKIEQKSGKSASELVHEQGWEKFRELEHEVLLEITQLQNAVIGTGGGVLMYFDHAERLKASGTLILLTAEIKTLQERLKHQAERPSLTGSDVLEELEQVWQERKDRYHQSADRIIDTEGKTPAQIVQEIGLSLRAKSRVLGTKRRNPVK